MNSKKIILLGCIAACVFAASTVTAMRGHGGSMGGMGMRGGFMPHSMGRMPMQRAPMMNSPSGFRRFGDRNFNRNDRFGRFNRFNDFDRDDRFGDFDRDDRFFRFNHFNDFIFIGDFGFPWWWSWGWYPWWGWGYPYGYYGSGYGYGNYGYGYGSSGYDYGYGYPSGGYYGSYYGGTNYGNGYPTHSRVAQLQRRLARAGYYSGAIDGILGPETRQAIPAFERDHAKSINDAAAD